MRLKASDEIVVQVGAEGGSYTLARRRGPRRGWKYFRVVNEAVLDEILEDLGEASPAGKAAKRSPLVDSFEAGLALLDTSPQWVGLFPLVVHPEFRSQVLAAVTARMRTSGHPIELQQHALKKWRRACNDTGTH